MSICNIGHSVDIRVTCHLNIHGHEVLLHAFLNSGTTNSTIDEATLLSIWSTTLIKMTNQSLSSTQFDGHLSQVRQKRSPPFLYQL